MKQINVAIVSYQNTIPFLYGLQHSDNNLNVNLLLTPPFMCAENLQNNNAEVALIPAVKLLEIDDIHIFSDYCIGASCNVYSVALFSASPVHEIKTIYLDTDSRTSVELLKILCGEYWKINPEWKSLAQIETIGKNEGCLLIGDKVFEHESNFRYKYDLATHWHNHTGKHFVFAVWVARNSVSLEAKMDINNALKLGIENISKAIETLGGENIKSKLHNYLNHNIEFNFTDQKAAGLELFLNKVKEHSSH